MMHFSVQFFFFSFLFHISLGIDLQSRAYPDLESVVRTASSDPPNARVIRSPQDLAGSSEPDATLQSFRDQKNEDIYSSSYPTDSLRTRNADTPSSLKHSPRDSLKSQEKYYDLNEGIEPESAFHEKNLGRTIFFLLAWMKQLWLRVKDNFFEKLFKREIKRIYKTPSKKSLYDPAPLNRWNVLDEREMKDEAAELKKKLLEDFRSHPLFLKGEEKTVKSPELVRLLTWFEQFNPPKDWSNSDYSHIVESLLSQVDTREKLDSEDILKLQLIKYIGFFNPQARELFKAKVRGYDSNGDEVPQPSVWQRLITADLSFQDYSRQTLYPHRFHGLLDQSSMEWREEFRRRFIAGKLSSAAVRPPPGFRRREERYLRKILGELQGIQFITKWPIDAEGLYNNPERLVRKCVRFLAHQAHLPPQANTDSNRQHPIKLVYILLNHIYQYSKGDFETQMLIERLIKRDIYCQKTIYAHVLLRQNYTPREFATLTLLEDIGFYDLLTPGMRKHLQDLSDREVALNIPSYAYKNPEDILRYAQGKQELPNLVIPSSNSDSSDEKKLDKDLDLIIERLDLTYQQLGQIENGKISMVQYEALSEEQTKLISRLVEVSLKGPRIWRRIRDILMKEEDIRLQVVTLLINKTNSILKHFTVGRNKSFGSALADFLYPIQEEMSEFLQRSYLIVELRDLVNDKLTRNLIDEEAANDIVDFLSKIKNVWLEIKWTPLKWTASKGHGAYDTCPVEIAKDSLKLIREYGFGRLPADVHEGLVNLMTHLSYGDGTGNLGEIYDLAILDPVDYRAFAFFQRMDPEDVKKVVDSKLETRDGLSEQMKSRLRRSQEEPTVYTL